VVRGGTYFRVSSIILSRFKFRVYEIIAYYFVFITVVLITLEIIFDI